MKLTGLIVFILFAFQQKKLSNNVYSNDQHFSVYINKIEKISFRYPSLWDTTNKDRNMIFVATDKTKIDKDSFPSGLYFYKAKISAKIDLAKLLNMIEFRYKYEEPSSTVINKSVLKNENNISFGLFEISAKRKNIQTKDAYYYFFKGEDLFILELISPTKKCNFYTDDFKKVITSVSFTD